MNYVLSCKRFAIQCSCFRSGFSRFARVLPEAFGGANGELKSAMQYFVQAFSCHNPHPDKYDMLMDIATEELGHLEIVGATIQMLLGTG